MLACIVISVKGGVDHKLTPTQPKEVGLGLETLCQGESMLAGCSNKESLVTRIGDKVFLLGVE